MGKEESRLSGGLGGEKQVRGINHRQFARVELAVGDRSVAIDGDIEGFARQMPVGFLSVTCGRLGVFYRICRLALLFDTIAADVQMSLGDEHLSFLYLACMGGKVDFHPLSRQDIILALQHHSPLGECFLRRSVEGNGSGVQDLFLIMDDDVAVGLVGIPILEITHGVGFDVHGNGRSLATRRGRNSGQWGR